MNNSIVSLLQERFPSLVAVPLRRLYILRNDSYIVRTFRSSNKRITTELDILNLRLIEFEIESGKQRCNGQVKLSPSKTRDTCEHATIE